MFVCQECQEPLAAMRDRGDAQWICPKCRARLISFATIDRLLAAGFVRPLREKFERGPARTSDPCPSCRRNMREVAVTVNAVELAIDACKECEWVRLAAGDFEQLPRKPRYDAAPQKLLPHELAIREVELDAELRRERRRWSDDLDDLPWPSRVLMWLGLPVDADAPDVSRRPLATWSLGGALVVLFLIGLTTGDELTDALAWIPAELFRLGGLTLITSFFLHGGWLHLLGNLYFLLAFGRGVEERIGAPRMLLLLCVATALGNVTHALFDPRSNVPCIGASGGLSALILFYAATYPWNRFAIVFWFWLIPRTLILPAVVWAALWFAWQIAVGFVQHFGAGQVSGLAHLGGAVTGIGAWFAWRQKGSTAA